MTNKTGIEILQEVKQENKELQMDYFMSKWYPNHIPTGETFSVSQKIKPLLNFRNFISSPVGFKFNYIINKKDWKAELNIEDVY